MTHREEPGQESPLPPQRLKTPLATSAIEDLLSEQSFLDSTERQWTPRQRIGKYNVEKILGCHGQATVVLAQDPQLQRNVVLKIYHRDRCGPQSQRIINEGRALARIRNPNVTSCYGVDDVEDFLILVMEYFEGVSLAQYLEHHQPSPAECYQVFQRLAIGVASVHDAGLIHGDLKPANVLVNPEGKIKIIDFGLVQSASDQANRDSSGTPAYMAPERARGDSVDIRSDIFGLGAIFYDVLTGRAPFQAETSELSRQAARVGKVAPPSKIRGSIDPALDRLCVKCLAQDPRERFHDAHELAQALESHIPKPRESGSKRWTPVIIRWAIAVIIGSVVSGIVTDKIRKKNQASKTPSIASVDIILRGFSELRQQIPVDIHLHHEARAEPLVQKVHLFGEGESFELHATAPPGRAIHVGAFEIGLSPKADPNYYLDSLEPIREPIAISAGESRPLITRDDLVYSPVVRRVLLLVSSEPSSSEDLLRGASIRPWGNQPDSSIPKNMAETSEFLIPYYVIPANGYAPGQLPNELQSMAWQEDPEIAYQAIDLIRLHTHEYASTTLGDFDRLHCLDRLASLAALTSREEAVIDHMQQFLPLARQFDGPMDYLALRLEEAELVVHELSEEERHILREAKLTLVGILRLGAYDQEGNPARWKAYLRKAQYALTQIDEVLGRDTNSGLEAMRLILTAQKELGKDFIDQKLFEEAETAHLEKFGSFEALPREIANFFIDNRREFFATGE